MNHINNILIEGNLVAEPELVAIAKGSESKMVKFTIASNRSYCDKDGKWQKEVLYLPIVLWGKLADNALAYMSQGMETRVVGRLRQSRWESAEGEKRSQIELVAQHLEFRRKKGSGTNVKEESIAIEDDGDADNISIDKLYKL